MRSHTVNRTVPAEALIVLGCVIALSLITFIVSSLSAPVYQSEAFIHISTMSPGIAFTGTALSDSVNAEWRETQMRLIRQRPLAQAAITRLGLETSPDGLLGHVDVSADGQQNVVGVTATDKDPKRAAAIANTLAQAYVDWSRDVRERAIKESVAAIEAGLKEQTSRRLALNRKMKSLGPADQAESQEELASVIGLQTAFQSKLELLKVNERLVVSVGRIVAPAVPNTKPTSSILRNTLLAALVGFCAGLVLAYFIQRRTSSANHDRL